MLDVGTTFEVRGMRAEAKLSGGPLVFLGDTDRSSELRLLGAQGEGPAFPVVTAGQSLFGVLGGTVKAEIDQRTSFEVSLDTLLSEDQQQYLASAKLTFAF
jgi:hypothetical protein